VYSIYGQILESDGQKSGGKLTMFTSTSALSYPDVTFNISDTEYVRPVRPKPYRWRMGGKAERLTAADLDNCMSR